MLLDLTLPRLSGIDVCREIRRRSQVPIIILSATTSEIDAVVGLEVGADDYVAKPYRPRELVARIRAALRRATRPHEPRHHAVLEVGDVRLDRQRHEVKVSGAEVKLPLKEFELLELLMRHPRQVLSRERILDAIWRYDFGGQTNVVDVYIGYLRQKLEADGGPRLIQTVRGIGFVLRET